MKAEERREALQKRDGMSEREHLLFDKIIVNTVRGFLLENKSVMSYRSIGSEVCLDALDPDFRYAYPKTEGDQISAYISDSFREGAYHIQEPAGGRKIDPQDLDIILVPLVAFDEQKHRLGHGKGYYDRFLKQTKALKIGIAYECQKSKNITVTDDDVSLDLIITEEKIY